MYRGRKFLLSVKEGRNGRTNDTHMLRRRHGFERRVIRAHFWLRQRPSAIITNVSTYLRSRPRVLIGTMTPSGEKDSVSEFVQLLELLADHIERRGLN
jgi:hypothetical protein